MKKLNIEGFPEAVFDPRKLTGHLCSYYSHKTLDHERWRETYSPEVLNFKEGTDSAISYFVAPFVEMIEQVLGLLEVENAYLVPVPSSIAKADPSFSSVAYNKAKMPKRKNRDNRCELFAERIRLAFGARRSLIVSELVVRTKTKIEKGNRKTAEQIDTLALAIDELRKIDAAKRNVFILIDDVQTSGGTFETIGRLLKKSFLNPVVVSLSIAKSVDASSYRPLYQGSG